MWHVILMVLALGLVGCGGEAAGPGPECVSPPEVGVLTVHLQSVEQQVVLPGRVVAWRSAEVRPQISGLVQRRLFEEGSQVQAGQLLFELDGAAARAARSQAQAQWQRAQARADSLAGVARRSAELIALEGVSRQEHEDAESALSQAQAELAAARAALDAAEVSLSHTRIRAPIAGRIGRAMVSEGALVTEGQAAPLASIVQLDPVVVDLVQPSPDLQAWHERGGAARSATVQILLPDGRVHPQTGELRLSEAGVDPATGAVTLRARVPNPQGQLLPGLFVRAALVQARWPSAVSLPFQAVRHRPDGTAVVWVLDGQQQVQERTVRIEAQLDGAWVVGQGLRDGEQVVVQGLRRVSPGQRVRPTVAPA